jgi:hypothetical protein
LDFDTLNMATRPKQPDTERIDHDPPSDDDRPQLVDAGRWDGTVTGAKTGAITWGTYEFAVRVQCFESGRGNVQVGAPSDPPVAAGAMLADWITGSYVEAAAAQILADAWDIDISEVAK